MTRVQADLWLLLTSFIWGTAFIAQKDALSHMGPFAFTGIRFMISAIILLPLAWWERGRKGHSTRTLIRQDKGKLAALGIVFASAVILQQQGLLHTSVTNAGFLTGLYVVMVPIVALVLLKHRQSALVWVAAVMSVGGVWLLSGGNVGSGGFNIGDAQVLLSAVAFAFHVTLIGMIAGKWRAPFFLSCCQYLFIGVVGTVLALLFEETTWQGIEGALPAILYAAILSGGVAYTLQAVAQQHTPPADASIIMSAEALFAALAGYLWFDEKLSTFGLMGCAVIMLAILLVEFGPILQKRIVRRTKSAS